LVISFAPAIGPTISGWIITSYSWRTIFYIMLPIGILEILIGLKVMKNVTTLTYPKLDILSIILSTFGFGGLLYGFTSAGYYGWTNNITIISLIVGVISVPLFIICQLRMHVPLFVFLVFKNLICTFSVILPMIAFMGLIGTETLVPLYMQNMRGFSAMESGIAILPGALINGMMSPITGRIFDRYGAKWLAVIGFIILTVSTLFFA